MVKVTEELWDKYDQEVRRLCNDSYFYLQEIDFYSEVMKKNNRETFKLYYAI